MKKVGLIVDSGSDVPKAIIEKYDIQELPLMVTFKDGSYRDGVEISSEEVYERMTTEIPTTSLASGSEISDAFETLIDKGCTHILAVTISSALSGTFNAVRLVAEDYTEVKSYVLDTKNIGIGSGLYMIAGTRYFDQGDDFDTVVDKLNRTITSGHVFFHIPTLEYLIKGGRIGKVAGSLGNLLKIQPIITCDEEGVYTTVAKFRVGRNDVDKAIKKLTEQIERVGEDKDKYLLAYCGGSKQAQANMAPLQQKVESVLRNSAESFRVPLSSALGVHTGPDLLGCAILPLI